MKKLFMFLPLLLLAAGLSCSGTKSGSTGSVFEVSTTSMPRYLISADVMVLNADASGWNSATLKIDQPIPQGDAAASTEEILVYGGLTDTTTGTKYPVKGLYTPSLKQFTASVDISVYTYQISYTLDDDNYFTGNVAVIVTDTNEYGTSFNFEGAAVAE